MSSHVVSILGGLASALALLTPFVLYRVFMNAQASKRTKEASRVVTSVRIAEFHPIRCIRCLRPIGLESEGKLVETWSDGSLSHVRCERPRI